MCLLDSSKTILTLHAQKQYHIYQRADASLSPCRYTSGPPVHGTLVVSVSLASDPQKPASPSIPAQTKEVSFGKDLFKHLYADLHRLSVLLLRSMAQPSFSSVKICFKAFTPHQESAAATVAASTWLLVSPTALQVPDVCSSV